jgi:PLP dependent protein
VTDLEANLRSTQERIADAAMRAGRDPTAITLVAVTKAQSAEVIRAAYDLGLRNFGENRVEEAEAKVSELAPDIIWHMIGHTQSRKAERVANLFHVVHSVDSVKLARRLDRMSTDRTEPLPVLLEINVSGEASKYGFLADRWTEEPAQRAVLLEAVAEIAALPHLELRGLMTMAPIVAEPEQARPFFARLRRLRDELAVAFPAVGWRHLSMGMTDDFEVAVEEGATLVRIGRAIFAPDLPSLCQI